MFLNSRKSASREFFFQALRRRTSWTSSTSKSRNNCHFPHELEHRHYVTAFHRVHVVCISPARRASAVTPLPCTHGPPRDPSSSAEIPARVQSSSGSRRVPRPASLPRWQQIPRIRARPHVGSRQIGTRAPIHQYPQTSRESQHPHSTTQTRAAPAYPSAMPHRANETSAEPSSCVAPCCPLRASVW